MPSARSTSHPPTPAVAQARASRFWSFRAAFSLLFRSAFRRSTSAIVRSWRCCTASSRSIIALKADVMASRPCSARGNRWPRSPDVTRSMASINGSIIRSTVRAIRRVSSSRMTMAARPLNTATRPKAKRGRSLLALCSVQSRVPMSMRTVPTETAPIDRICDITIEAGLRRRGNVLGMTRARHTADRSHDARLPCRPVLSLGADRLHRQGDASPDADPVARRRAAGYNQDV